jgi:hypothetical protein
MFWCTGFSCGYYEGLNDSYLHSFNTNYMDAQSVRFANDSYLHSFNTNYMDAQSVDGGSASSW